MIIAIGYRVNSKRGTQFRKWANSILKQYLLNGYSIGSSINDVGKKRFVMTKIIISISKSELLKNI
jgi:hypothetical protein